MEQNIYDLINKHKNTTCCFFCYPCTKDIELSLSTVDSDSDSNSDSNSNTTLILYMEKIVLPTNSGNLIAIFFYVCFVLFHRINDDNHVLPKKKQMWKWWCSKFTKKKKKKRSRKDAELWNEILLEKYF